MTLTYDATGIRRRRIDSPERWQRALERAVRVALEVRQLQGSGQWIVTSASDPGAAYETDGQHCTCPAAMLGGDPVCMHRAAYRFITGRLRLDPEAAAPGAYDSHSVAAPAAAFT
jgi:hypothetical protein